MSAVAVDDVSVEATERDRAALRWVAEQYAVTDEVLAVVLGRLASPKRGEMLRAFGKQPTPGRLSRSQMYRVLARWRRAGWATRPMLLGRAWTLPTAAGYRRAGFEPWPVDDPATVVMSPWRPRLTQLAHVHAVAVVRLALEQDLSPEGRWVSERELRRDAARERERQGAYPRHTFDGATEVRPGQRLGVDVELTLKSPGAFTENYSRPWPADIGGAVLYVSPRSLETTRKRVRALAAKRGSTRRFAVEPLPETGIDYLEG